MPKYLILHNANEPAREFMAQFTLEQKQAGVQEWLDWKAEADKKVTFEFGMPLQPVVCVTPQGSVLSDNRASGYSIIEAASKEVVETVLKNHPHLKRNGASMDVLEMIPMEGV